jgi:RNA polymerase sigma-70 factor (ECF subfamily)
LNTFLLKEGTTFEINEQIIKGIKNNDRKVILKLYEATFNLLMSVAVRYHNQREEQMEIVNSTFLKVIDKIVQYEVGTNFYSWTKRIAHHTVIDHFRSNKRYKEMFSHQIDDEGSYIEPTTNDKHTFSEQERIELVLSHLPPATRISFNLFAIDGYSYKEIAEQLDVGYETVKWHVKEARKRLKKLLKEDTLEIER